MSNLGQTVSYAKQSINTASSAPESEVDSQISQLFDHIVDLDQRLDTLGVRLMPVLSPRADGGEDCKATADLNISPIADRVRTAKYRVAALTARVEAILGSLAV